MHRYVLILLALPFVAHAETLYVQYEGRVLNLDEREGPVEGYEIGDSVAGTLIIDTERAPLNLGSPQFPTRKTAASGSALMLSRRT